MASTPDSMISVRVAVRIRPLSGKELHEGCQTALRVIHGRPQITLINCEKSFTYDFAYDTTTPQVKIYNESVDPLVDKLFKGEMAIFGIATMSPSQMLPLVIKWAPSETGTWQGPQFSSTSPPFEDYIFLWL